MGFKEYALAALSVLASGCQAYFDFKPIDNQKKEGLVLTSKCGKYVYVETENGFYVQGPFERKITENGKETVENLRGRLEYHKNHPEHGPLVKITTEYRGFPVVGYDGWKANSLDGNFDHLETSFGSFDTPDGESIKDQRGYTAAKIAEIKGSFQAEYSKIKKLITQKFGEFVEIPDEPPPPKPEPDD